MTRREAAAVLGVLGILVAVTVPELGSDPWPFRPTAVDPQGILGPLVRAADREWDLAILRAGALMAGVVIAVAGAIVLSARLLRSWFVVGVCAIVIGLLALPATLLQVGLRDATRPWYFVNDSTYQIDLAGELVLDASSPYGHDYAGSGLERV